ncbi:hypothetical protein [uncultured Bacteroides sp.]|uniref:hypothetical protein n=1 Tax=uncultured Bacteroides sp. TaxID=162156 RepID=UPI0025E3B159|nr:hypothetical protein [uncultured Bacteroides sp.]
MIQLSEKFVYSEEELYKGSFEGRIAVGWSETAAWQSGRGRKNNGEMLLTEHLPVKYCSFETVVRTTTLHRVMR